MSAETKCASLLQQITTRDGHICQENSIPPSENICPRHNHVPPSSNLSSSETHADLICNLAPTVEQSVSSNISVLPAGQANLSKVPTTNHTQTTATSCDTCVLPEKHPSSSGNSDRFSKHISSNGVLNSKEPSQNPSEKPGPGKHSTPLQEHINPSVNSVSTANHQSFNNNLSLSSETKANPVTPTGQVSPSNSTPVSAAQTQPSETQSRPTQDTISGDNSSKDPPANHTSSQIIAATPAEHPNPSGSSEQTKSSETPVARRVKMISIGTQTDTRSPLQAKLQQRLLLEQQQQVQPSLPLPPQPQLQPLSLPPQPPQQQQPLPNQLPQEELRQSDIVSSPQRHKQPPLIQPQSQQQPPLPRQPSPQQQEQEQQPSTQQQVQQQHSELPQQIEHQPSPQPQQQQEEQQSPLSPCPLPQHLQPSHLPKSPTLALQQPPLPSQQTLNLRQPPLPSQQPLPQQQQHQPPQPPPLPPQQQPRVNGHRNEEMEVISVEFQCDLCDFSSVSRRDYTCHLVTHQDYERLTCAICRQEFSRKHRESESKSLMELACDVCLEALSVKSALRIIKKKGKRKDLKCFRCDTTFANPDELLTHERSHYFSCADCPKTFKSKGTLQVHINNRHTLVKKFRCDVCEYATARSTDFAEHRRTHGTRKSFKCSVCGLGYSQKRLLLRHLRTVHLKLERLTCEICSYKAFTEQRLELHVRTHTAEKPSKCQYCAKLFPTYLQLRNHVAHVHHQLRTFRCEICAYAAPDREKLKHHLTSHTGDRPLKCGQCSFATRIRAKLRVHLRTHTGEKPFACGICDYSAITRGSLKLHMLSKHAAEKPLKCKFCDFRAVKKYTLKLHEESHTKSFKCATCEITFFSAQRLSKHMKTHTESAATGGEYPLQCPICKKLYSSRKGVQIHKKNAHGEKRKPFMCERCPYATDSRTKLANHVNTHTGEKPFACSGCGQTFVQKSHMTTHMKRWCRNRTSSAAVKEESPQRPHVV